MIVETKRAPDEVVVIPHYEMTITLNETEVRTILRALRSEAMDNSVDAQLLERDIGRAAENATKPPPPSATEQQASDAEVAS